MLNAHLEKFMAFLRVEKNASSHTLSSYKTDLDQFFTFAYPLRFRGVLNKSNRPISHPSLAW